MSAPYDSKASEMLTVSPFFFPIERQSTKISLNFQVRFQFVPKCLTPGWIVPPYTIIVGLLCRTAAMKQPGMFLSHPGIEMFPS